MNSKNIIYLDNAATTPLTIQVASAMQACLNPTTGLFANSGSKHLLGNTVKEAIETARTQVATTINAQSDEIIFTSGATESINLALKGASSLHASKGRHIITLATEHSAVLDTCAALERQGLSITRLKPDQQGLLPLDSLKEAIRPDTALISILHVNNETGVVQNLDEIASITASLGILLHVDAAQTIGKLSLDVKAIPLDLVSLSAHKCNGPKGVGALFLRKKPRVRVAALLHGGGQEQNMRSGTLATHQIIGMAEAFESAEQLRVKEFNRISLLRDSFLKQLADTGLIIHGNLNNTVPHILNISFPNIAASDLLEKLPNIAISTGSACHGKSSGPSHVLLAMDVSRNEALRAIRISFGRFNTATEINSACKQILKAIS